MPRKTTVSISLILVLLSYASRIGIDPVEACQAVGLPLEKLNDPENRISAGQFYALWRKITKQTEDPYFGLHVAELSRNQFSGDILGAVMLNCPTVGSAMEKLIRYHDLSTDVVKVKLVREADQVLYAWVSTLEINPIDRQISEAIICRIFFTLEMLSNGKMPFSEIRFRHQIPNKIKEHRRIFGCSLKFGVALDAVVVRQDGLDLPIPLANPKVLARLEAIARELLQGLYQPDTWSEQVSQRISKILLQGEKPHIESVARQLAISPRQLQNKLKIENTTYRALLDQVRMEMALQYLQELNGNILDTAFLLGFSDQSSFSHAFKRWTGKPPGEFRQSSNPRKDNQ
jgi:AraC-like DNA-binding protein